MPILIRLTTAFVWFIAPRSKELRLAEIDDLDLRRKVFRVRYPKGEGAYGVEFEEVAFDERFLPYAEDFLAAREARIRLLGLDPAKVRPLAPTERGVSYCDTTWNSTRRKKVQEARHQGRLQHDRKSSLQNDMKELGELGTSNTRRTGRPRCTGKSPSAGRHGRSRLESGARVRGANRDALPHRTGR